MLIDTHCHLNFKAFEDRIEEVINSAKKVGVDSIIIPGTDIETSKKAVEIAEKFDGVYAAVGIHPHHVFKLMVEGRKSKIEFEARNSRMEKNPSPIFKLQNPTSILDPLSSILLHPKVVAIGEIGIDKHQYQKTKHKDYKVDEEFVELQKEFLVEQIKLAQKYKKSLIIHNREAKKEVLEVLSRIKDLGSKIQSVFHCCEPDEELLEFARRHKMFIGVDGDVVYWKQKQEFIKKVPLDMLVLETDSPYLSPFRKFPNEPKNIPFIADFIAELKSTPIKQLVQATTKNAKRLFARI